MPQILVVDDSPIDRRLIGEVLRKGNDFEVDTAENGRQALAVVEQRMPDIVVTDLQMPELDGLQLVRAMRMRYPEIPVVLITAHGSEELAIEALEQGAASYVPKSQMSQKLVETVEQVLARIGTDRGYERLSQCMTRAEFTFDLENDPALVERLVELVRQLVSNVNLYDSTGQLRVMMALEEALFGAMLLGNLELTATQAEEARRSCGEGYALAAERRQQSPYDDRSVLADLRVGSEEARFVIRHQGNRSDLASRLGNDHVVPLEDPAERGLVLIRAFMDEVACNADGTEVTLIKRRELRLAPVSQESL